MNYFSKSLSYKKLAPCKGIWNPWPYNPENTAQGLKSSTWNPESRSDTPNNMHVRQLNTQKGLFYQSCIMDHI